ncbi:hypothetical protein [Gemmatimonas sp.]|uniref:hypothetical protein n=1 Tax=Gemmatimonas sp. TaxID=1962908 RepID=UPI002EDB1224
MCVAVSTGLFDAAINYIWNAAVLELRRKVRDFGLQVVAQIRGGAFDERALVELKDSELVGLCLRHNLITEDGHFFLDQCREVRNNFSAAHPPMGTLDEYEVLRFTSACIRYALEDETNPRGVDTRAFLTALRAGRFNAPQLQRWVELLTGTHEAQRDLLFSMLHGLYCDPASSQEIRLNSLDVVRAFAEEMSAKVKSELVDRHSGYLASGDIKRQSSSQDFFTRLGIAALFSEAERHSIITRACQRLLNVHQEFNNFYNEPPFAERLHELAEQSVVPDSALFEFVCTVVVCATGNQYGVSNMALPYYESMVRNFKPKQIAIMLEATETYPVLATRLKHYDGCRQRFRSLVSILDRQSVPSAHQARYDRWS